MKTYTIKKGFHGSGCRFPRFHWGKKSFAVKVCFDESCLYDHGDGDQKDWNKLFGLSYLIHQHNSVRIGWRVEKQYEHLGFPISIVPYYHESGVITAREHKRAFIRVNRDYRVEIIVTEDARRLWFTVSSLDDAGAGILCATVCDCLWIPVTLECIYSDAVIGLRACVVDAINIRHTSCPGYYLWPYFGGNKVAPHDMRIDMEVVG